MPPVIELKDVTWIESGRRILSGISWRIEPGEHWALLGLNGSGKTSLLKLICGYIPPSEGTLSVLGQEFGQEDWREVRRTIGFVSSALQERLYPAETALEIVLSGIYATIGLYDTPQPRDIKLARAALRSLGAGRLADRPYATLSQGERQRVLVARSLAGSPAVLILDEPCEGLDIIAREGLLRAIESIASGPHAPVMIYVTHRAEEITPAFTHALLLKAGRVHLAAPTRDALTSRAVTAFLETRAEVHWRNKRPMISLPA